MLYDKIKSIMDEVFQENKKYKQTLTEIKEIAEKPYSYPCGGVMTFFSGSTEVEFEEEISYFEAPKTRKLKFIYYGTSDTGEILIDNERLILHEHTFFEALREALNRLTI